VLSGSVDHLLARDRALEIVRAVKGVRSVVDRLTVMPEPRSDEEIFYDLYELYGAQPVVDADKIAIHVDQGVVKLEGVVDSYQEKTMCDRLAREIRGVVGVKNRLKVAAPEERPDPEIEADVKSRLAEDVLVRAELIQVSVDKGKVSLSGIVGSAAEKQRAKIDAWVTSVKDVNVDSLEVDWRAYVKMKRTGEVVPWLTLSDKRMQEAVADAFRLDPRIAPSMDKIEISVFDTGETVLAGEVRSLSAKRAAEETASNTVGIRRVFNHLRVRPDPEDRKSDSRLADEVESALRRDPYFSHNEIEVRVINGRVVLRGFVDFPFEKKYAGDVAARMRGVIEIDNRLRVNTAPHEKRDEEILADVKACLYWNARLDGEIIDVTVRDGVVTLKGRVDNPYQYREAVDCAYEGGAVRVNGNHLEIESIDLSEDTGEKS
jgi:osmotically-inducible protein OsmY